MKKMYIILLAASTMAASLSSCEKESPAVGSTNSKGQDAKLISVADLEPNYVYTLVGTPDKYVQDDGIGDQASFINLFQLAADDGYLYAVDQYIIRKIKISDRSVTTLAGDRLGGLKHVDGLGKEAVFNSPSSLALGPDGNLYVAELGVISKVTKEGKVTTVAGSTRDYQDGPVKTAKFNRLTAISVCEDGTIYVIDNQGPTDYNDFKIRKVSPSGIVSTLTSGPSNIPISSWTIESLSVINGTLYAAGKGIFKISPKGQITTVKENISVFRNGLLALADGGFLVASNNQVQRISASGSVSVFAGIPITDEYAKPMEGPADSVDLHTPSGFILYNNVLYIPVHPHIADLESPYLDQGHVIQMIAFPH
jgi:hypothetical protein